MASERRKRDTIFPGSSPWVNTLLTNPPSSRATEATVSTKTLNAQTNNISEIGGNPSHESKSGTTRSKRWGSGPGFIDVAGKRFNHAAKTGGYVPVLQEPPWNKYRKLFKVQFGGDGFYNTVARATNASSDEKFPLVLLRNLTGPDVSDQLQVIQRISHPNIVSVKEVFDFENVVAISYEYLPMSLSEVAGNPLLEEFDLASIVGQVLDGLAYLEDKGLEHGQLACSNILIDLDGTVKLWGHEGFVVRSERAKDIRALSNVLMELMQGYTKEDGAVGIENLKRWPSDSFAVSFLSTTQHATEIRQLLKHPLLQRPWSKSRLRGLFALANIWASRGLKYPP